MYIPFLLSLLFAFSAFTSAEAACQVEAYFTEDDNLEKELIAHIDAENKSIHVATYELGLQPVVDALIRAKKRGAEVEIIGDNGITQFHLPFFQVLFQNQIPVLIWKFSKSDTQSNGKWNHNPIMHNKFFIFGGKTVWTGSYNLTRKATLKNAENAISITDDAIAKEFETAFQALKADSFPYVPKK